MIEIKEEKNKPVKRKKALWLLFLFVSFLGILGLLFVKRKPGEIIQFSQNNTEETLSNHQLANSATNRNLLMPGMSGQDQSRNYYLRLAEKRFSNEKQYLDLIYPQRDFYQYVEMWKLNFYAYQYSNDIKYAEKSIEELQAILETKPIEELCADLQVFSVLPLITQKKLQHIYDRLIQKLDLLIKKDARQVDGAILYYCGVLLNQFEASQQWREVGSQKMQQGPAISNSYHAIQISYLLINALYFAKQYSLSVEEVIKEKAYFASYELMMRLEPDGSPPSVKGMTKRINYRETIWRAALLFDLDDLRFVAYNALQNADIQPPKNLNEFFEKTKTTIFRDTWNITWLKCSWWLSDEQEKGDFQKWLGQDTTQMTIELKENALHLFSFNKPQLMIEFTNELLSNCTDGVIESTEKSNIWSSKQKGIKISFAKEKKPLILIESTKPLSQVELRFYLSEVAIYPIHSTVDCLLTTQSEWGGKGIEPFQTKERGFLKIESDVDFKDVKIDNSPKYFGYNRTVSIVNCTRLMIECNPGTKRNN